MSTGNLRSWAFIGNNSGDPRMTTSANGSTTGVDKADTTMILGLPQSVAMSYDSSDIEFYRNGQPDGSEVSTQASLFDTTADLVIGAINAGTVWPFEGTIETLIVSDTVLTPENMSFIYELIESGQSSGGPELTYKVTYLVTYQPTYAVTGS